MQTVRTGQAIPIRADSRVATARRVKAARVMAGRPSLRRIARETGCSYTHLVGVLNATEPLTDTDTDAVALGELLGCPPRWLRRCWEQHADAVS